MSRPRPRAFLALGSRSRSLRCPLCLLFGVQRYLSKIQIIYKINSCFSYRFTNFHCLFCTKTMCSICAYCLLPLYCVYCTFTMQYFQTTYSSGSPSKSSAVLVFAACSAIWWISSCDNAGVLSLLISICCTPSLYP